MNSVPISQGTTVQDVKAAPLRLNGGGDTSFRSEEDVSLMSSCHRLINEDVGVSQVLNEENAPPNHNNESFLSQVDMENSMSEQDIRDVMFEAGYTIDVIDGVLSAKVKAKSEKFSNTMLSAGLNDVSNSTVSVESDMLSTEFIRGGDLTDLGDISVSDSGTENAFDTLKEIQLKNVN